VALLRAMPAEGPPVLSWSTVSAPALVLGRLAVDPTVNWPAARDEGVEVVRRSSGGGPVLWDAGLLSLDAVLPPGHPLAGHDVVEAYRWLGEAIASALRTLGVEGVEVASVPRARAAALSPGPAAEACFGGLSPHEVLVGGRKVVGLSQARRRPGALLQAGILMRLDAARLARLLCRDSAFARDLAAGAAGLGDLRPALAPGDVVGAVDRAVAERAGALLEPDGLTAAERGA